jgi:uncharacterized alpha-E superfamily protein
MLSRVADAMYWMNRYIERAENYARFLDVNFNLSLDLPPGLTEQWKPLVVITGDWNLYSSLYDRSDKNQVIYFMGFDQANPNSILNCIIKARENARAIRPEITREVWEQTNYLYYLVRDGFEKKRWQRKDPRNYFVDIKKGCQMLYGIIDSTISRTDGWHFGKAGQLIERADKTSRVLDVKYHILLPATESVGSPLDLIQWAALLKSVSSYDMYRKKYGKLNSTNISRFLILDKAFPRSILRCLILAEQSLHSISGYEGGYSNTAEKQLGQLRSSLEYTDIGEIIKTGLHEYLDDFQKKLNEISTSVFGTYFSIENIINSN